MKNISPTEKRTAKAIISLACIFFSNATHAFDYVSFPEFTTTNVSHYFIGQTTKLSDPAHPISKKIVAEQFDTPEKGIAELDKRYLALATRATTVGAILESYNRGIDENISTHTAEAFEIEATREALKRKKNRLLQEQRRQNNTNTQNNQNPQRSLADQLREGGRRLRTTQPTPPTSAPDANTLDPTTQKPPGTTFPGKPSEPVKVLPQNVPNIVKKPEPTTNQPTTFSTNTATAKRQNIIIGVNNSLKETSISVKGKSESLVLTNDDGHTHGILITEDKVIISGGAHSTNMLVDDAGVTFKSTQNGGPVVVSGVADGVELNDAANVGQVQTAVDAAVTPLHGRIDGVENAVQRLDQKINEVEKKLSGGVAMAMALSQPVSFAPQSKSAVTGGVATYNGQTAMGFSFNRLLTNTETRRTVVSLGVAATTSGRSSASARIGASFSW